MAQTKTQFGYRRHPDQDRAGANAGRTSRSSWSARVRWGCRWRSIWRSAAKPSCCSTMPTGSARARARSASQNARSNSGTGSASASAWSTRAWCGASARSFTASSQLYQFNLLPEEGHKRPAFINLQQFYAEAYLVDRVGELARYRPALAQQGDRARTAQRPCAADDRNAGRSVPAAAPISSSPATAPDPRCGRWWARNSQGRCSRISS